MRGVHFLRVYFSEKKAKKQDESERHTALSTTRRPDDDSLFPILFPVFVLYSVSDFVGQKAFPIRIASELRSIDYESRIVMNRLR